MDIHDTKDLHRMFYLFVSLCQEKINAPLETMVREQLSLMQFYTLCAVHLHEPVSMTNLSSILYIPKQNATKIVDRLIDAGLAERRAAPSDRRVTLVSATPAGVSFLTDISKAYTEKMFAHIHMLGEKDFQAFFSAMEEISRILRKL